ncbi:hypothetical protein HUK45_00695 [Limosilactobacillus sp. c9Ua_26_M]|uniref:Bacterial Ig domain-containing protein n=1 Tax=Limosilactobacillus urinaemulieris TaxID=2742600 RepID=A0ABR8ZHL6_9LACO|nr:hypothetical protein [Limosilactobacillus urinaemulieris]MBD8084796.1 hypothetical protein [Limosilactobacillus urinaemulieris]
MKKFVSVLGGVIAGLCLFITPTLASRTQLTVNIPDGHNAQVTNQSIKIDSENDGSVTFTGKADKDAVITIEKHNGNKHHYKVKPDENGNFTKKINLATSTKKCKFIVSAKSTEESQSNKEVFVVKNTAYVKPAPQNDDSSASSEEASSISSSSSSIENNGDMKTDEANGLIVGNSRSKIYHTPDQQGYHMNSANAVYFNSEAEA